MSKKEFRGEAIVCFIDILGFSDDIRKNWGKSESDPEHPLNKILAIKKKVKEFDNILKENSPNLPNEALITIGSISDSFVIRVGFEGLHDGQKIIRLYFFFRVILCLWIACIINGYTIRGAISIGNVYWDNDSIIAPTFIDVYKLESTVAKNSRIIISSDMNKELKRLFDMEEKLIEECKTLHTDVSDFFNGVAELTRKDVDGYLILNPKLMLSLAKENPIIELLSDMKNKIENKIVKEKYTPLINMLKNENPPPLTASDFGHY